MGFKLHDRLLALCPCFWTSPLLLSTAATATHQSLSALCYPGLVTAAGRNGVSGSIWLPRGLPKRRVKEFLKAGCFLQGGEGVSSGGSVTEKKGKFKHRACDLRSCLSDFPCFPKLAPLTHWEQFPQILIFLNKLRTHKLSFP